MTLGDPLLDLALTLRMSIGGVDVAERRVAGGCRLAQCESRDAESCISVRQARPPFMDGMRKGWLAAQWPLAGRTASARGSESRLQAREHEPGGWHEHEQIREQRAVLAFRAIRLGGHVPIRVVERQQVRLGRLVERIDDELKGEQHEEGRRYLEIGRAHV